MRTRVRGARRGCIRAELRELPFRVRARVAVSVGLWRGAREADRVGAGVCRGREWGEAVCAVAVGAARSEVVARGGFLEMREGEGWGV